MLYEEVMDYDTDKMIENILFIMSTVFVYKPFLLDACNRAFKYEEKNRNCKTRQTFRFK